MNPLFMALLNTVPYVPVDPPTGPPISVKRSFYSGGRIQLDVKAGDATAVTRLYEDGVLFREMSPGTTSFATGAFTLGLISASHYKGGVETVQIAETEGGEA